MASSLPKLSIRVKSKKSQNAVLRDVDPKESVQNLIERLSTLTEVPQDQVAILKGFPPKRINFNRANLVETLELQHQDTIIVENRFELDSGDDLEPNIPIQNNGATTATSASAEPIQSINGQPANPVANNEPSYVDLVPTGDEEDGLLLRQVVPSDNSCLFTSVTFCLSGGQLQTDVDAQGGSAFLRELIANTVAEDPVKYNEAILGRPNKDYVNWIKKPESWGGGIELSILAGFYGIQICVVDTQSLHISCFGEDQNFPQRMFLIYDGIHYDPLYFEPFSGGPTMTMYPTSNAKMMELATQLAKEAKASNQFTDVKNFALRCQICNSLLKGEEEAQAHAKKTGHASFAEIDKTK